jgi:hypothetical protein
VVDLLDRASGEPGLVFDQVLQPGLRADRIVAQYRQMPGPIRTSPHRVHTGQATDITGNDPAGCEQEAGQRNDTTPTRARCVIRITPQRIVVADAMRVVTD